ncbi:MAG: exodeoxyribonuclease VII large subunit [Smithellaceae bacterium]|nr:exodeoxyribonuclease VII large subunit [Smithellaceae bacterium]
MEMRVEYTVSQLNSEIKELLEAGFSRVLVEGEVSNLRRPASGHIYFTLKDEKSQIRAVMFRGYNRGRGDFASGDQGAILEEGISILCRGRIGVHQERGEYQIIVDSLEPRGYGALQRAFEMLKERLGKEGLFDPRQKKTIPFLPRAIGVVTSPTGSVIRDILQITRRRFPSVDIYLAPARVQGSEAAEEIVRALGDLQQISEVEVVILARGGGSLEDLAPFNDERVARAIFASRIPVVSAVGHETDFTIADFVADLRAPTPSAAAELVLPMKRDLMEDLLDLKYRLIDGGSRFLKRQEDRLGRTSQQLKDPRRILQEKRFILDDRLERIRSLWLQRQAVEKRGIGNLTIRLGDKSPLVLVRQGKNMIEILRNNMIGDLSSALAIKRGRLQTNLALLGSLNPLSVLSRGYSITRSCRDGSVVKDSGLLEKEGKVEVRLARGRFEALVTNTFGE